MLGFKERLSEVDDYLNFLATMEEQSRNGPPRLQGADHPISAPQQRILYSSVYLLLYNLVEATMSGCIEAVASAAVEHGRWRPGDLSAELRREWVRAIARTHEELHPQNRLESALKLCEHLLAALPVAPFELHRGGGGNWDDRAIETLTKRIGCSLAVSQPVLSAVKRQVRNDLGPLGLVRDLRNRLAHGAISFAQCSENETVERLLDLKNKTAAYLEEVVASFVRYIDSCEYLIPDKRPA